MDALFHEHLKFIGIWDIHLKWQFIQKSKDKNIFLRYSLNPLIQYVIFLTFTY